MHEFIFPRQKKRRNSNFGAQNRKVDLKEGGMKLVQMGMTKGEKGGRQKTGEGKEEVGEKRMERMSRRVETWGGLEKGGREEVVL